MTSMVSPTVIANATAAPEATAKLGPPTVTPLPASHNVNNNNSGTIPVPQVPLPQVTTEKAQRHLLSSLIDAKAIYAHYIDIGAPNELNLSPSIRSNVRASLDSLLMRAATANYLYVTSQSRLQNTNTVDTVPTTKNDSSHDNRPLIVVSAPTTAVSTSAGGIADGQLGVGVSSPMTISPISALPLTPSPPSSLVSIRLLTKKGVSVSSALTIEQANAIGKSILFLLLSIYNVL
jgi:hypothetical protein